MPVEPTLSLSAADLAEAMAAEQPDEPPSDSKGARRGKGRSPKASKQFGRGRNTASETSEPEGSGQADPGVKNRSRSARPAFIIIAAVLVVALIVAGAVWLITLQSRASGGPASPDDSSALDPLVTSQDLGNLGGLTWETVTGRTDEVNLLCLSSKAANLPVPARTVSRKTPSNGSRVDFLSQTVDTYADAEAATQAYAIRLTQAGTCADDAAWITGADSVTGLADSADAVRLVVQEQSDEFHTLLLSRTGRTVSLVDVSTSQSALKTIDVANVVGKALARQCGGDLGTCPSAIQTEAAIPPKGDPAGWLVQGDLPRINPSSGRWGATKPFSPVTITDTQCEGDVDLRKVSGANSSNQRTLLLNEDPDAHKGFGVDMVTYEFAGPGEAKKLTDKLTDNIKKCPSRTPTATVKSGPAAKAKAADGSTITGSTFTVVQATPTTKYVFRVAVMTVDNKVVYLLANPTTDFDFTDSQWKAITNRAGQRASQA